ncbi:unnamed protein product [Caenorhabditis bovis]|uniref:Alpha-amylase n=1 Tax=Caenorhabditis bovis TaxID=2654633 RepID=A0A8S1E799_9PELO|nr:unnamed protein product [Caenorhabditis bovis]
MLKLLPFLLIGQCMAYNFYWYDKTQTLSNRQVMVHLFEWKWRDVANECENFLQHYGYGAVQVSPPNEHIVLYQNNDVPWWVRYQPVSYKLQSRSGNEAEFKEMVERCNKVGVRIIVDVVMNHMVGIGEKNGVNGVKGSAGSDFDGRHGVQTFPGVPYTLDDFNNPKCDKDIGGSDYQKSAEHVKNCRLVGLLDLNQGSSSVRAKIVAYLNKLVDYGVAGFRHDASKHMWPDDILAILNSVKDLRVDIFGANQRPFAVHEVIDRGGEAVKVVDYLGLGRYTNFNFGSAVSSAARGQNDWRNLAKLGPGYAYGNNEDHDVVNFIDNHDNQRDSNPYVVTYKDGRKYELAVAFMLAWPYGYPRVMSSYSFSKSDQGPPNTGAANDYATASPRFNSDETCDTSSGFVCEHRWPSIRQMSKFRSAVEATAAAEIVTDNQRIAFARDGVGFFALNQQSASWGKIFKTTLPAGDYCDYFSGGIKSGSCVGAKVSVNNDGTAYLNVPSNSVIAISVSSRIGGSPPPPAVPSGYSTTVIFIKKDTQQGQDLFIRGGASNSHNGKCAIGPFQQDSYPCAIPIRHNTTVPFVFAEYLSWSQQDNYLDFEGAEEKQGTHDGRAAFGTPLAYSTNDKNAVEYQPLNKYGAGYWMAQLKMDCGRSENGWFEVKGYLTPTTGWESDVKQSKCSGSIGGSPPFSSINHVAKCGAINVFNWNSGDYSIWDFSDLKFFLIISTIDFFALLFNIFLFLIVFLKKDKKPFPTVYIYNMIISNVLNILMTHVGFFLPILWTDDFYNRRSFATRPTMILILEFRLSENRYFTIVCSLSYRHQLALTFLMMVHRIVIVTTPTTTKFTPFHLWIYSGLLAMIGLILELIPLFSDRFLIMNQRNLQFRSAASPDLHPV